MKIKQLNPHETKIIVKAWCPNCQTKTMIKKDGLYLKHIEIWECLQCHLLERHLV